MFIVNELKQLPTIMKQSAALLRKTKTIVGAGLFSALHVILSIYGTFYIIPNVLKISFAFIAYAACGFLYGPIVTGVYGAVLDILIFLVRPDGEFFIGYTISAFITGFLYGALLYNKKVTVKRCFVTKMIVSIVINLCLTPLWMYIMGWGDATIFFSSVRVIKNIVLLPIETAILYVFLRFVERHFKHM